MTTSTSSILRSFLRGISWFFFVAAGLAFCFGGQIISAFAKGYSIPAELEGISAGLLFVGLGIVAKIAEDRLEENETDGPKSIGEALRK
jgi:hypothetical protein